jgi:hypothetical protein
MIEVKVEINLSSERSLRNDDPINIFDLIAESFHDDQSITEQDLFADYGRMVIEMQMHVQAELVEKGITIALAAVNSAVEGAKNRAPWVNAAVGSVSAGQLAAA